MRAYLKAIVPAAIGLVLVVVGLLLHDPTLPTLGYGFITAAAATFGVPNQEPD